MASTLLLAVAVASSGILSPGSMLLTLLILSSTGGPRRALAYYAGYFGAYVALGVMIVVASGRLRADALVDEPSAAAGWISVAIGVLLSIFALRAWRSSPDVEPRSPKLFAAVDTMRATKLLGLGALVSVINIKNLSLFGSAIAIIVEGRLPALEAVLAVVVTAFVFCLAVLGPILVSAMGKSRAQSLLRWLRAKIEGDSRTLMLVILTALSCVMLTRGVLELSG